MKHEEGYEVIFKCCVNLKIDLKIGLHDLHDLVPTIKDMRSFK